MESWNHSTRVQKEFNNSSRLFFFLPLAFLFVGHFKISSQEKWTSRRMALLLLWQMLGWIPEGSKIFSRKIVGRVWNLQMFFFSPANWHKNLLIKLMPSPSKTKSCLKNLRNELVTDSDLWKDLRTGGISMMSWRSDHRHTVFSDHLAEQQPGGGDVLNIRRTIIKYTTVICRVFYLEWWWVSATSFVSFWVFVNMPAGTLCFFVGKLDLQIGSHVEEPIYITHEFRLRWLAMCSSTKAEDIKIPDASVPSKKIPWNATRRPAVVSWTVATCRKRKA